MNFAGSFVFFAVYLAVAGFGLWLAYLLVFAILRISRAFESASRSLEEITKACVDRNGTPGR